MILSLIVPIYNTEAFILECINSILPQLAAVKVELICINDGTTDNAMNLVKQLVQELDEEIRVKITLFDQENKGVSEARNKGLELAKGEYIAFIDSDDKIAKNYIKELLECIENYRPDIIDFNLITSDNTMIKVRQGSCIDSIDSVFRAAAWYNCARIFKKSLIKNKFITEIYYEDLAFFPILYVNARTTLHLNEPLYWYRLNHSGITMSSNEKADLKTIRSLETVLLHFLKLSKETSNGYFAVAALQTYFLLCVNACRRIGYSRSIYYLKKYESYIMLLSIDKNVLDTKMTLFYNHRKRYLTFYYLYCYIKYGKRETI